MLQLLRNVLDVFLTFFVYVVLECNFCFHAEKYCDICLTLLHVVAAWLGLGLLLLLEVPASNISPDTDLSFLKLFFFIKYLQGLG
jgi:hypothetical protein